MKIIKSSINTIGTINKLARTTDLKPNLFAIIIPIIKNREMKYTGELGK